MDQQCMAEPAVHSLPRIYSAQETTQFNVVLVGWILPLPPPPQRRNSLHYAFSQTLLFPDFSFHFFLQTLEIFCFGDHESEPILNPLTASQLARSHTKQIIGRASRKINTASKSRASRTRFFQLSKKWIIKTQTGYPIKSKILPWFLSRKRPKWPLRLLSCSRPSSSRGKCHAKSNLTKLTKMVLAKKSPKFKQTINR